MSAPASARKRTISPRAIFTYTPFSTTLSARPLAEDRRNHPNLLRQMGQHAAAYSAEARFSNTPSPSNAAATPAPELVEVAQKSVRSLACISRR